MNRWLFLLGYVLLVTCTQVVWLSFAPMTDRVATDLGVSVTQVGWLSAIFAGVYILLGFPVGRWLDTHFRKALAFGAICNAVGAAVRVLAPEQFAVQLAAQFLLAVGQPFVVGAVSALAIRYFPPQERPKVIAAGSAGFFVGVMLASVSVPILYGRGGLPLVLLAHAIPTVLAAFWVLLALRTPPTYNERLPDETARGQGWAWLWQDKLLLKLAALLFVGFGLFSALSTWLEPLLGHFGIGAATTGNLLGVLVVGGILGTATLPVVAAARDWRKEIIGVALLFTVLVLGLLANVHQSLALAFVLGTGGFFLLSCLPIILEWAEGRVAAAHQGAAAGFLMCVGNAGSLSLTLLVGSVVERSANSALVILCGAASLGLLVLNTVPKTSSPRPPFNKSESVSK